MSGGWHVISVGMKKFIIIVLLALVGLYIYWPHYAVGKYRDALNAGDTAAVSGMVDYAELRKSLRAQLLQKMSAESPVGGAAVILGGVVVDKLLEGLVGENDIGKALAIGKLINGSAAQEVESFRWVSPSQVAVTMTGDGSVLTFALKGTSWKLVGKDVGATFSKLQSLLSR